MREIHIYSITAPVIIPLLMLGAFLQGALPSQGQPLKLPLHAGEQIVLTCDRSIYGVNEQILFSAAYRGPEVKEGVTWSTILYAELIHWDGAKLAMSTLLIEDNRASGVIRVPDHIPSGVYYLRAYTKWMRNYDPVTYAYLPVRILNPSSNEMVAPPSSEDTLLVSLEHADVSSVDQPVLSGLKEQYKAREYAEFGIMLPENLLNGRYSLSIAKTASVSSADYSCKAIYHGEAGEREVEFLPETEGLSLSGKIVDPQSGTPVAGSKLQLSSYGHPFFYAEVTSSRDGSFLFSLPHFNGNPEFQLAEARDSLPDHKILLAAQYCNKPVHLPYVPLMIDSAEQSVVREILLNAQLRERFGEDADPGDPPENLNTAFYGSSISVTHVKDYIELSNLREFIYEILPQVSVRGSGKGEYIVIQGPSCLDFYPPLVLIDNVPVPNDEELLSLPGSRIDRIEVLNQAYMVGKFRYSGILSLFSNKKDMAGISQGGERHFFNLHLLDNKLCVSTYQSVPDDPGRPDVRNLLYWEPELKFTKEGTFRAGFSTSDASGQYVITLRGLDPGNSSVMFRKAFFTVK